MIMQQRPSSSLTPRTRIWAAWWKAHGGRPQLDRERLVRRLPPVEYHRAPDEQQLFHEASLPTSLPLMLKLDQEAEYLLCREVAERLLGFVPDPDELPE